MRGLRRATPITRNRLGELADVLEQESTVPGEPDWRAVVAVGRELVLGGRAQLRRQARRRASP